ncbi:MAG: phosphohydrolase [Flavobacteriales bacterium]|nr:MAG: phosphohydrolase [Flavobacteriales bacterium]
MDFESAKQHALGLLEEKLPQNLYYHGIHHTHDVCKAIEKIAELENVNGNDLTLLKTATVYHDAGFINEYEENEPVAVEIAKQVLPKFGYSAAQIDTISKIILATQVSKNPATHLEQIMCDADLFHLGSDNFHALAIDLKKELEAFGFEYTHEQWDTIQVKFLEKHEYYTESVRKLKRPQKLRHIEELKQRIKAHEEKRESPAF